LFQNQAKATLQGGGDRADGQDPERHTPGPNASGLHGRSATGAGYYTPPASDTGFKYPSLVDALAATHPAPEPGWVGRQWHAFQDFVRPVAQPIADWENRQWEKYAPDDVKKLAHAFAEGPRLNPFIDAPFALNEALEELDNFERQAAARQALGLPPQEPRPERGYWHNVWDMMSGNSGLQLPLTGSITSDLRLLTGTAKNARWVSTVEGGAGNSGLRPHFEKHGPEIGANTAREYDLSARQTIQDGLRFTYQDRGSGDPRVDIGIPKRVYSRLPAKMVSTS
jgi:hypothetical protein